MTGYEDRDTLLVNIGYADYSAYLASPLWRSIRGGVLARNKQCEVCRSERAVEVHHMAYDADTLAGRRTDTLLAVCDTCHRLLEFNDRGQKQSLEEANATLAVIRGWKASCLCTGRARVVPKRHACERCGAVRKKGQKYCERCRKADPILKQEWDREHRICPRCHRNSCRKGRAICDLCARTPPSTIRTVG